MNKLTIIGNLTRDPQLRTTQTGVNVCDFTVAVNRRQSVSGQGSEGCCDRACEREHLHRERWRYPGEPGSHRGRS